MTIASRSMASSGFSVRVPQPRDLPDRYGAWETVAGRFYAWQKNGLWQQILEHLQQQADAAGQFG